MRIKRTLPTSIWLLVIGLAAATSLFGLRAADENAEIKGSSASEIGFLRFVDKGPHQSHIDTAIATYSHPDGQKVDLIAAIHVADSKYYLALNERFKAYDALLYELIAEPDTELGPEKPSQSTVSTMQRVMKDTLDLSFQLDVINYKAPNFVHADMDPDTFANMQKDRGESIFGIMMKSMLTGFELQAKNSGPQMTLFQLFAALASRDRAQSLKYLLGRDFGQMEQMLSSIDETEDGEGSVLLSGRNRFAMDVLKKEIRSGKKHLAVFYGAGHMPDMEKRLFDLGFKFETHQWYKAWDIGNGGEDSVVKH